MRVASAKVQIQGSAPASCAADAQCQKHTANKPARLAHLSQLKFSARLKSAGAVTPDAAEHLLSETDPLLRCTRDGGEFMRYLSDTGDRHDDAARLHP